MRWFTCQNINNVSMNGVVVCQVSPPQMLEADSPPPLTPAPSTPPSPASIAMEITEQSEEIIREQKRRIEQLQRQLLRSQLQLQQQSTFQVNLSSKKDFPYMYFKNLLQLLEDFESFSWTSPKMQSSTNSYLGIICVL